MSTSQRRADALNEMGLGKNRKDKAYSSIREMIFSTGEGRERHRHSKSSYTERVDGSVNCTICLATDEYPVSHYANLAGVQQDGGERSRCINILVGGEDGLAVVDSFPSKVPMELRPARAAKLPGILHEVCAAHHGAALEPFVRFLMAGDAGILDRVHYLFCVSFGGFCCLPSGRSVVLQNRLQMRLPSSRGKLADNKNVGRSKSMATSSKSVLVFDVGLATSDDTSCTPRRSKSGLSTCQAASVNL